MLEREIFLVAFEIDAATGRRVYLDSVCRAIRRCAIGSIGC
jgi:hypothetical protein